MQGLAARREEGRKATEVNEQNYLFQPGTGYPGSIMFTSPDALHSLRRHR